MTHVHVYERHVTGSLVYLLCKECGEMAMVKGKLDGLCPLGCGRLLDDHIGFALRHPVCPGPLPLPPPIGPAHKEKRK